MMRLLAAIAALTVGLAAVGASAQPVDTTGATACQVRGWVHDTDPTGTNVRSAPRANALIIGRLAPLVRITRDETTGVEFDIVGSKDGWLLIRNGSNGGLTFDAAHAADGRGWVSAKLVSTQLRMAAFRSAPHREAPVITTLRGDDWGPESVAVLAIYRCQGQYIEVTATRVGGKPLRGWSFLPCSSQLTTCDGGITE